MKDVLKSLWANHKRGCEVSERLKEKLAWWIVKRLPKRVALYAFCMVHGITGEGPSYNGEYKQAYDMWTERHGLK